MFSKAITLLAFVTCAVAQFGSGVYEIYNVEFRNYPVRGSSDGISNPRIPGSESPRDPADVWRITLDPEGGSYTIKKYDEETNPLIYAGVPSLEAGQFVDSFRSPTTSFAIEAAGPGEYTIKIPDEDLVWTVAPFDEALRAYPISIEAAVGTTEQRWFFAAVSDP